MDIAALILSSISLLLSLVCLIWLLSKHLSKTEIQMVPVDPFKDAFPKEMGKDLLSDFRDIGDPLDQDEIDSLIKRKP